LVHAWVYTFKIESKNIQITYRCCDAVGGLLNSPGKQTIFHKTEPHKVFHLCEVAQEF
jgi:hypothetical protein